jgi:uncharacterized membrane protein
MAPDAQGNPGPQDGQEAKRARPRRRTTLKTSFLTGLVVAAPLGITILLVWSFVDFVDRQVRPIINRMTPANWHEMIDRYAAIPGLGLLLVIVVLTLLGMLTANIVGRTVVGWGDRLVHRMPVIGTIYKTLKQIFETVVAQTEPAFKQVCLIEYPSKGLWALAFVIGATKGEIQAKLDDELLTVFLPTTPNPTTGFMLFIPKKDVKILDMSVEEGAKMLISAGIVTPEYLPELLQADAKKLRQFSRSGGLIDRITGKNKVAS